MTPDVSVVVLTKNGGRQLTELVDAIRAQRTHRSIELVLVDSGSSDGSLEPIRERVDRFLSIAPSEFHHARTRNFGIDACLAELVVLVTQDALPANENWLELLVAPFDRETQLAGTFSRQQPRTSSSAVVRRHVERAPVAGDVAWTSHASSTERLRALSPIDRFRLCTFDNVSSCVRRKVWAQFPFDESIELAEDVAWAREVLLAGWEISFVPESVVIHSHDRSIFEEFDRTRRIHRELRRLFELRTISGPAQLFHSLVSTLVQHLEWTLSADRSLIERIGEIPRAMALAATWPLGQYLGGRLANDSAQWTDP